MTSSRSNAHFPYLGTRGSEQPPAYERVVRMLRDDDIMDELAAGKGTPEYQQAVAAEAARRGIRREDVNG